MEDWCSGVCSFLRIRKLREDNRIFSVFQWESGLPQISREKKLRGKVLHN